MYLFTPAHKQTNKQLCAAIAIRTTRSSLCTTSTPVFGETVFSPGILGEIDQIYPAVACALSQGTRGKDAQSATPHMFLPRTMWK